MNPLRRMKRAHPKLRARLDEAEARGWRLGLTAKGHVALFDAAGRIRWVTAGTPGDQFGDLNAACDLGNALRKEAEEKA